MKQLVGRPKNFRMKESSKKAISESKTGYKHSEETKLKISEGVKRFNENRIKNNLNQERRI